MIEYLRGKDAAQAYIDNIQDDVYMSDITLAELYSGVRKGKESSNLEAFIESFNIISLNKKLPGRVVSIEINLTPAMELAWQML